METILVTSLILLLGIAIGWVGALVTYKVNKDVREFDEEMLESARLMVAQAETIAISGEGKLAQAVRAMTNRHPLATLHEIYRHVIEAVDELKR